MSDGTGTFPWNEGQWARARKVVEESARQARVGSSFLPLFGPLPADQVTVGTMMLTASAPTPPEPDDGRRRLEVDDYATVGLTSLSADIYLRTSEAADPEMSAALSMLGRTAVVLARVEDSIIFNGLGPHHELESPIEPKIYQLSGGSDRPGLIGPTISSVGVSGKTYEEQGTQLVGATVDAISQMESEGHYGPFTQVLGDGLYRAANTPNANSMVLPSDRIVPFLGGGPLLRSGTIPPTKGVIVALGGEPIDLVVGRDLTLKFVQMTLQPRYVLRLSERFTLRIKQQGAIRVFEAAGAK